jgi:precorrin-6A/cobalt-precorrin-6A reductase
MTQIWLVGGTSESRDVAHLLSQHRIPWLATVTRESARRLYRDLPGTVRVGLLTPDNLTAFLHRENIQAVVDASHPFAAEVSRLAMSANCPYLRYDRPRVSLHPDTLVFPDFPSLLQPQYLENRRVLLTVGVKALPDFQPWCDRAQLWARVLPSPTSIEQARAAGFAGDRLIPQRLPVTLAEERQLWQHLGVDTVIAKAAGKASGLDVKQMLAQELGVRLLVVDRPAVAYPQITSDLATVLAFAKAKV